MPPPRLLRTDSTHPDFLALCHDLDKFLAVLNGDQHGFYAQFNGTNALGTVVVAYGPQGPSGIGAFRAFDEDTVEIKRMFVTPELRGHGIAGFILAELEDWAAESGYGKAVLETSKRLEPAVNLYRRSGYAIIPNFGPYVDVADSVCMAKTFF